MPRQRPASRGRARRLAAAAGIVALTAAGPVAAGPAAAGTAGSAPQQVTVAITSVSPQVARPGKRVTVTGTVRNGTATPQSGVSVQLWSSSVPFGNRSELASYAAGQLPVDLPVTGALATLPGVLGPGAARSWTVTVPVATLGMTQFGVYPLAAQADTGTGARADDYTFLPFWPGSRAAAGLTHPEQVAWIWPLIAPPGQAACHALLSNRLAGSLGGTGRLGGLLAAGTSPAGVTADLTWAIDPSLLSSVAMMTQPYRVGGTPTCTGTVTRPASPAARAWLARVHALARQQDFFTTPYADVDVSALAHAGLGNDLARALAKGREVAASPSLLGAVQQPAGRRIDWPANGIADYGVLGSLAANGIGTVVLNSSMMPPAQPVQYTPSAITTTPDGVNAGLHVALADAALARVLAAAPTAADRSPAATPPAAAAFSAEQRFLAETAMIAAERPGLARSVVITPPRQWNPAPGLAAALLQETDTVPWLQPASLSSLLAAPGRAGQVTRKQPPPQQYGHGELHRSLLRKVRGLEAAIRVQASMLGAPPARYLSGAVAAIESSAWRGDPAAARHLLSWVSSFVAARAHQVRIIDSGGQVTLTGKSGPVPVSIINKLGQPVTVRLLVQAPSSRLTILYKSTPVTIAKFEQKTVAVRVRSSVAGSTVLKLSLLAPNGSPLPGPGAQVTVDATHFGTEALVIVALACGLFVLVSAGRAVRRGRRAGSGPAGQDATRADPGGPPDETDTVNRKPGPADIPEEPDEYASAPGRVERP
ncbi:MAG TPA: DUF6049 family protein [Streptosporangiaceae bacterium]|nr:DUF6049 family protein [Streptosporangiaceae bacterium]